ncbi:MAG TPA: hypothetical protein VHO01_16475 [Jatrophihabitans sp.]|nr:hypothetical protein [Jatrophihabitans sp.]
MGYDETTASMVELLAQVGDELRRQDVLWGEQDHPFRLGRNATHIQEALSNSAENYAKAAGSWKRANDRRVQYGIPAWDSILLEEVYEALAETNEDRAVTELIQVAAVAINAALSIQRNGLAGKTD